MQWDSIGAELIYIQDYRGKYLAFAWHKALAYYTWHGHRLRFSPPKSPNTGGL